MDIKQKYREETNLDVYPKGILGVGASFSNEYVKWLEEQLRIAVVGQQRELFKSFLEKVNRDIEYGGDLTWQTRDEAKELLKLFNCG
tara:strand:+ start:38 stop:298 length:261 start_codon:yes stop_codon:yes gene_type:complete